LRRQQFLDTAVYMVKSIRASRKYVRTNRPAGQGTPVQTRLQPYQLAELDDWRARQDRALTRPAALRELMMIGILHAKENDGKAAKRGARNERTGTIQKG
jgi:hypothetical protein